MAPVATDPSDELSYLTISEDLVPTRPTHHSQIVSLDFNNLLNPPLTLQTDVTECGGQLWPAGMVLAEYLLRNKLDELRGRTILELGAGSGLVGLAVSLGLSNYSNISNTVHITDGLSTLLPLLQKNVSLNKANIRDSNLVIPSVLAWGKDVPPGIPKEPDIILAADCVYFEPAFPLLLQTMRELMGEETTCWFCFKKRRRADKDMMKIIAKAFNVQRIEGHWESDGIWIFEIRREEQELNGR